MGCGKIHRVPCSDLVVYHLSMISRTGTLMPMSLQSTSRDARTTSREVRQGLAVTDRKGLFLEHVHPVILQHWSLPRTPPPGAITEYRMIDTVLTDRHVDLIR